MLALERANEIRLARAKLKRQIKAREASAAEAIAEMPDCIRTMKVIELIACLPSWGKTRARKWLRELDSHGDLYITEARKCGSLTERERRILAERLRTKEKGTK